MSDSTQSTTGGYWALARSNANFRYLWSGQIISLLGDWFNLIASAALIAQLTESGLAVGTLFVVRMLAPVLISPLAGVAADRYNRKHILIVSDIGRFFTAAAFLFIRSPEHVWFVYLLSFLQLGIGGFFFPARSPSLASPFFFLSPNTGRQEARRPWLRVGRLRVARERLPGGAAGAGRRQVARAVPAGV